MSSTHTELIASTIESWLNSERTDADRGRNAVLSDFDARKADLIKDLHDPSNINGQKTIGHHNRLRLWSGQYVDYGFDKDDYATARLTFCGLMFLSGNYREQTLLQADSPQDYFERRYKQNPLGVDIAESVERELSKNGDQYKSVDLRSLLQRTQAVNNANLDIRQRLNPLAATPAEAISAIKDMQRDWLALSTAQIMVWAVVRDGDLANVPFFEPKSITNQAALQYPLVGQL